MASLLVDDTLVDVPECCGEDMEPLFDGKKVLFVFRYKDGREEKSPGMIFRCESCGANRGERLCE